MAKLLKLRRGTTAQHASFTGAEGELTIDITKDTAVVHDGSTQSGHTLLREDLSNLPAGQIDNADVNASAAIAGTKITPDFGSQNVATTGTLAAGATTVTGNLAVSGTVDGRDVALDGSRFDEIYGGSNQIKANVHINDGSTAVTQAQSDNSIKLATTAYVRTAVSNLVDSAPATLDTLNELAAALGDDANYATTTANSIGTKLSMAGGQMTGNITMAGSQTVDGRDLSADGAKLDTYQANGSSYLRSDTADEATGDITFSGGAGAVTVSAGSDIRMAGGSWTGDYTSGIKIQPNASDSYFQYQGTLEFRKTNGAHAVQISQSGDITAVGNVTAYSDARLKTDIHTINDALGICGKLRGVSYKWIADGKPSIGVIAQEVEEVIPEVVLNTRETNPSTGETTEIKSVDYGKIVGVLINAINELKAEVDELKGGK